MPHINRASKEIIAKLVWYGPGFCGKTTNLQQIHARLDPSTRGRLTSLETDQERTLFFDMLPVEGGELHGMKLRFQLYTVPGQVYYNSSRRLVLQNADGVVFVADSQPSRLEANVEAMQNLYDNLRDLRVDPALIPLVLQFNKRDVPGALPVEVLQQALNYEAVPAVEAVAATGLGVLETLAEIATLVDRRLRSR
jgi:mutual gliding-motility protein MglA